MTRLSVSRSAATPAVQIDNERVRVTEWRFAPGEATGCAMPGALDPAKR